MVKFLTLSLFTLFSLNGESSMSRNLKMRVGQNSFSVILINNETTKHLKKMLPLTIKMKDLNRNEKYYDLQNALPEDSSNPVKIKNGDIMLYGANTLVLFYKSFPTTYAYTRLGQVSDPEKLSSVLGSDDVTVTFEYE